METVKKLIILYIFIIFIFINTINAESTKRPRKEHFVFFKNTQNELNVYKLYGRLDGNTVFILGGIQGDEPGGFYSADLYPNLVLEKGNLILIPRANFHSIITNDRGLNGDMNRKFKSGTPSDIEDEIVEIIKKYMAESDLFLNLHDGWGFYSDIWVGPGRNPKRFGQSIIADTDIYFNGKDTLKLEDMAKAVLLEVNKKISNPKHQMHFMNTKTFDEKSEYDEMKTSATYCALTNFGIPAYGIESSKNLNTLEEKIRYHNYAINEFLDYMGVEPEHPAIIYEPPTLSYITVLINNYKKIVVPNNDTLRILKGDSFKIIHIESNYERGLSCDVANWGTNQDLHKEIFLDGSSVATISKDNMIIGKISIVVNNFTSDLIAYVFETNGRKQVILDGQRFKIKRGEKFKILDILSQNETSKNITVNLKGYVPQNGSNKGEDRGYLIDTDKLYWKRYSLYGNGKVYPISVRNGKHVISKSYIEIID